VTICLVTDRRRLAAGSPEPAATRCLLTQVRHAAEAGVDLIQIRERDLEAAALAALVREALAAVSGTRTRIVVNERADVAIACGAHGVHLRSDSMPAAVVRRLVPARFVIGASIHGADDLAGAAGADYLIAGTVFPSESKRDGHGLLGVDGLGAIVRASSVPVLAIGGIALERMAEVAAAGASGVAAIGLFMRHGVSAHEGCRASALHDVVVNTRARFDSVISRS
jgi:thiamine-phosphate pyrophosphorylase